jgi:GH18 family chitinase
MGISTDYPNVPEWVAKNEGYQTGEMVKYKGNIFYANFWASEPGVGDADHNGWRFYDELYDQTPHTATEQAKIIAYIPIWRKKEEFNYANDEMYQYITHGIIAFLMFSETNSGEFDPASVDDVNAILADVVNTGHRNGARISIALGGATDYGFLNLMTSIGNNPTSPLLDQAVQNVINFVKSNNLDGVDLDLECWWDKNGDDTKDQGGRTTSQGAHPAGYALTLFAKKLKQAMPDKLVSATLFGTSWYGNNYDPKIADYVDWLGVMTYDLTGSWNASPVGPDTVLLKIRNQESSKIRSQESYQESFIKEQQGEWPGGGIINNPIISVEDTLWYWTNPMFVNWQGSGQKLPRNKIAAGVPIYGYDFAYGKDPDDLSDQVAPGYRVIRYKDILNQFPDAYTAGKGNIKVPGSTPRPPFISASGNYPYAHNIYYETPSSAVAKLKFLMDVGAQGVIIWELSNDVWEEGKSIIKALYKNSRNSSQNTGEVSPPVDGPNQQTQEILAAHNKCRAQVGVPSLQWSENLAESAQQWADHLAATGEFAHSGVPENLAQGTAGAYSVTQLVDMWGGEKQYFKHGTFPDVSTTGRWEDVGHYTQMIWKNTTEVGCGLAHGHGNDVLVCHYNPAGNVRGSSL